LAIKKIFTTFFAFPVFCASRLCSARAVTRGKVKKRAGLKKSAPFGNFPQKLLFLWELPVQRGYMYCPDFRRFRRSAGACGEVFF
jgi:hypothetical protein